MTNPESPDIRLVMDCNDKAYFGYFYEIIYDKQAGKFSCTCPAGSLGKECRHIKQVRIRWIDQIIEWTKAANPDSAVDQRGRGTSAEMIG